MMNQLIAGIVESTFPDHGETLAWRTTEYDIDIRPADTGQTPDLFAVNGGHTPANGRTIWKIKLVNGTVNGIDLDRSDNIESRLLEAERHPPGPGEEINSDGPAATAELKYP